jgi:hypothetical protein
MTETAKGRPCPATTKSGSPCKGRVYKDGETFCAFHRKTPEDQRRAQVAQARARRARKIDMRAMRQEVTEARAIDIASRCLCGVPLDGPSVRNYPGRREVTPEGVYIGLLILLVLTGPHLTPSAARSALETAVPPSMRPVFVPPVEDIYRAGRAEWRKAALMYSEAAGLFVGPYPPNLIAPWEDAWEVSKNEPLPTFEEWSVSPLGDSDTHVLATPLDGEPVIVRREKSLTAA